MTVFWLYIDPGTGSMLFSVLISLFALAYFAFKAAVIRLKVLLAGKRGAKSPCIPFVIYSEGRQYWNVFKNVVEEFERRKIPLVYYTSAKDDRIFDTQWQFVRGEFIGEGNRAFARLNILEADVCLMTTPGLDVFQLKRSKGVKHYAHILHMVNDATLYKRYGLDYFDSVLLSGDYQKEDIRCLEKLRGLPPKELVTVGSTYLDVQKERLDALTLQPNKNFTVLVAPSWGKSSLLSLYGEKLLDPLSECGFDVIIRPHPQSKIVEKELIERLKRRYSGKGCISWDFEPDNIVSISKADIIISDFSSITLDFAFLRNKPFLYAVSDFDARAYDAGKVDRTLWQFRVLPKIGKELRETDFARIGDLIRGVSGSAELERNRSEAKAEAWQHIGEAARLTADFLIRTQRRIGNGG